MKLILLLVIVAVAVAYLPSGSDAGAYDTTAEMCAWLKSHVGYGCDGKAEQWIWRTYQRLRYGVTDCNSMCVKHSNKKGGKCQSGATDNSSWCPAGQRCVCY